MGFGLHAGGHRAERDLDGSRSYLAIKASKL
jgi:hypothetical protein